MNERKEIMEDWFRNRGLIRDLICDLQDLGLLTEEQAANCQRMAKEENGDDFAIILGSGLAALAEMEDAINSGLHLREATVHIIKEIQLPRNCEWGGK